MYRRSLVPPLRPKHGHVPLFEELFDGPSEEAVHAVEVCVDGEADEDDGEAEEEERPEDGEVDVVAEHLQRQRQPDHREHVVRAVRYVGVPEDGDYRRLHFSIHTYRLQ